MIQLSKGDWAVALTAKDPKKPDAKQKEVPHYPWKALDPKKLERFVAFSIMGFVMHHYQAEPDDPRVTDAVERLRAHLGRAPEVFNDDPATTLEDVLRALKHIGIDPCVNSCS